MTTAQAWSTYYSKSLRFKNPLKIFLKNTILKGSSKGSYSQIGASFVFTKFPVILENL